MLENTPLLKSIHLQIDCLRI